jgi:hypothetical protein
LRPNAVSSRRRATVPPVPMSPETTTSSELLKVASAHEQPDFKFFYV